MLVIEGIRVRIVGDAGVRFAIGQSPILCKNGDLVEGLILARIGSDEGGLAGSQAAARIDEGKIHHCRGPARVQGCVH